MSRIFISYRRDDSRWIARALKNALAREIGDEQIFMDIDSIDPGADFIEVIESTVSNVDALIAIIGPDFATIESERGVRRLDEPNDFVRLEIAAALRRDIRVIPIMETGTPFPTEDQLPDDLKPLVRRNAVEISGASFERDVDHVVQSLRRIWEEEKKNAGTRSTLSVPVIDDGIRKAAKPESGGASTKSGDQAAVVAGALKDPGRGSNTPMIMGATVVVGLLLLVGFFMLPPSSEPQPESRGPIAAQPSASEASESAESAPAETPPAETRADQPKADVPPTAAEVAEVQPEATDAPPAQPKPAEDPVGPEVEGMVWIKPGTFMMGSPLDEKGRGSDETPHQVELTGGFYMGKYEITNAQFNEVMGAANGGGSPNVPATNMFWEDAMEFCAKLNQMKAPPKGIGKLPDGYEFTLPTEAQWEFACRAGNPNRLTADELKAMANCYIPGGKDVLEPDSVGSKQANAWGLHDMIGNVHEWCRDVYGPYPTGAVSDPFNGGSGKAHVIRGGYCMAGNVGTKHKCRAAAREQDAGAAVHGGFRVAAVRSK